MCFQYTTGILIRYVANRIQRFQLVSFHRRRCVTSTPQLVFTSLVRAISGASNPSGKGSRSGFPPDGYGDKSSCNFVVPSRIARLPQVLQTCELLLHQRTIGSPSPLKDELDFLHRLQLYPTYCGLSTPPPNFSTTD